MPHWLLIGLWILWGMWSLDTLHSLYSAWYQDKKAERFAYLGLSYSWKMNTIPKFLFWGYVSVSPLWYYWNIWG